jgi:hypothetical protein
MLQKAFKEKALSRTKFMKWYEWFNIGKITVENHPHSGRTSTSCTDENVEHI